MSIQSEAALEAGLIATLQQMDYEYVQIAEEDNLQANFKRQLEIHNRIFPFLWSYLYFATYVFL